MMEQNALRACMRHCRLGLCVQEEVFTVTIVPVYNMLLVPEATLYFRNDLYRQVTGKEPEAEEKVILLMLKNSQPRDEIGDDSFYPIGVSGSITEVYDNGFMAIRTRHRLDIQELTVYGDHTIEPSVAKRPDIADADEEKDKSRLEAVKKAVG